MLEHHDLAHEFPEYKQTIHDLKVEDAHFQKLVEAYHQYDKEIYRIEAEIEAASDERLEDLKKQRIHLKDKIYHILKQHNA